MILYNVSLIIEDSDHDMLLDWLKSTLRQNRFEAKFLKMLDSPHDGSTYCIQIVAQNEDMINSFQLEVLQQLQEQIAIRHKDKAFIFDSRMQYLALD